LDDEEVGRYDLVVMFHDEAAWDQDDEDRIVDAANWVVDCQRDAPARPVQTGKLITVSTCSITALHEAVRMALTGDIHEEGNASEESPPRGKRTSAWRRAVRVLAAEDNPVNAQLLADQLERLGADALVVNSGAAVLAELHSKRWDVLLTDLNMPDMHGDELCAAVRAELPELPSFVITAQATADERERCERAGARDILLKPVSMQTLYQLLQGLNASGTATGIRPPTDRAESIPAYLRSSFVETGSKSIEVLRDACNRNDAARMRSELHSLKGMFFMTRCREEGEMCEAIERALSSGVSDLAVQIDELAARFATLLATDTEDEG
jgi:two-component system capsular synthesis sensor histidine kinase RcsC